MSQEHEYSILGGFNRAKVGRYIGLLSGAISAGIVYGLLSAVDLAKRLGVSATLPPSILSLASAGTIFAVLYWIFDKYAWRLGFLRAVLNVPILAGDWKCHGQMLNAKGEVTESWHGTLSIVQSWDRLRIRLKTAKSGSNSISAALLRDSVDGYLLLYHYKNEPSISETELHGHRGFAELTFDKACKTAEGEYFNGHGRYTFGKMRLTRLG